MNKSFFSSLMFKLILVVIVALALQQFYVNYIKINKMNQEIKTVNQKIELARQKTAKLQTAVENVDDPAYVEEVARKELGLVKPGEMLVIPVEENNEKAKQK